MYKLRITIFIRKLYNPLAWEPAALHRVVIVTLPGRGRFSRETKLRTKNIPVVITFSQSKLRQIGQWIPKF